jgi:hypothetical protein
VHKAKFWFFPNLFEPCAGVLTSCKRQTKESISVLMGKGVKKKEVRE